MAYCRTPVGLLMLSELHVGPRVAFGWGSPGWGCGEERRRARPSVPVVLCPQHHPLLVLPGVIPSHGSYHRHVSPQPGVCGAAEDAAGWDGTVPHVCWLEYDQEDDSPDFGGVFFGSHQGTVKRTNDQDAGTAVWGAAVVAQRDRWQGTAAWPPRPRWHQLLGLFRQKRVAWEKSPCGTQAPFAEIN